jgi:vacuolar-type H+-ATPase subunit I/STV1
MVTIKYFSGRDIVEVKAAGILRVLSEKYCREKLEEYKRNSISIQFLIYGNPNNKNSIRDPRYIKEIKAYKQNPDTNHLRRLLKYEISQLEQFTEDLSDFRYYVSDFAELNPYIRLKGLWLSRWWRSLIVDTVCFSLVEEKRNDSRVKTINSLQKEIKQLEEAIAQFVKKFRQKLNSKNKKSSLSQRNLFNTWVEFRREARLKPKSRYRTPNGRFEELKRFLKNKGINLDTKPLLKEALWDVHKRYTKNTSFLMVSFGYLHIYSELISSSPYKCAKIKRN